MSSKTSFLVSMNFAQREPGPVGDMRLYDFSEKGVNCGVVTGNIRMVSKGSHVVMMGLLIFSG